MLFNKTFNDKKSVDILVLWDSIPGLTFRVANCVKNDIVRHLIGDGEFHHQQEQDLTIAGAIARKVDG